MAVLFAANSSQISTKNYEFFPFKNSLFLVASSGPCSHILLIRRRHPQSRIFYSPFSLRHCFGPPLPSPPTLGFCLAVKPGHPPPPPQSDPPPEPPRFTGAGPAASFSKFQDRTQILFAVLFWMSLFFWTSAWDEKNRPNRGSRFRR